MCKNHDQLHYHAQLRSAALWLAGGDTNLRDELLQHATLLGMFAMCDYAAGAAQPFTVVALKSRMRSAMRDYADRWGGETPFFKCVRRWEKDAAAKRNVTLDPDEPPF